MKQPFGNMKSEVRVAASTAVDRSASGCASAYLGHGTNAAASAADEHRESPPELRTWAQRLLNRVCVRGEALRLVNLERSQDGTAWVLTCGRRDSRLLRQDGLACAMIATFVAHPDGGYRVQSYAMDIRPRDNFSGSPSFLRWEYQDSPKTGVDPFLEPRSHLHPGHPDVRLPAPPLNPREILIWFAHMPAWW